MIKEDFKKCILVSGSGRKIYFDKKIYLQAVKFVMQKFKISYQSAKNQINYILVTDIIKRHGRFVYQFNGDKKTTNARLKNIITCDYTWQDLWNY